MVEINVKMSTTKSEVNVHEFGMYGRVSDIISAGEKQHPDCRIWAMGEILWARPESECLPEREILNTNEGIAMMSCR